MLLTVVSSEPWHLVHGQDYMLDLFWMWKHFGRRHWCVGGNVWLPCLRRLYNQIGLSRWVV